VQIQVDVLEIVLTGAADADGAFGHGECLLLRWEQAF